MAPLLVLAGFVIGFEASWRIRDVLYRRVLRHRQRLARNRLVLNRLVCPDQR